MPLRTSPSKWNAEWSITLSSTQNESVNVVSDEALMAMESLSIMDELDSESTLEEIKQVLDQLSSGKALGNDGIPVEVIKCAKGTLLKELHEILVDAGEKVRSQRT